MNWIGPRLPSSSGVNAGRRACSSASPGSAAGCRGGSRRRARATGRRCWSRRCTLNTVTVIFCGHFGARREPLGVGPALHHLLARARCRPWPSRATSWKKSNISRVFFRPPRPRRRDLGVVEQVDQRLDVVAADHRAEQLGGLGLARSAPTARSPCATAARNEAFTLAASSTPGGTRCVSRSSRKASSPAGGCLEQLDQLGGLLGVERQRRDAERGAFGDMLAIGVEHCVISGGSGWSMPRL